MTRASSLCESVQRVKEKEESVPLLSQHLPALKAFSRPCGSGHSVPAQQHSNCWKRKRTRGFALVRRSERFASALTCTKDRNGGGSRERGLHQDTDVEVEVDPDEVSAVGMKGPGPESMAGKLTWNMKLEVAACCIFQSVTVRNHSLTVKARMNSLATCGGSRTGGRRRSHEAVPGPGLRKTLVYMSR